MLIFFVIKVYEKGTVVMLLLCIFVFFSQIKRLPGSKLSMGFARCVMSVRLLCSTTIGYVQHVVSWYASIATRYGIQGLVTISHV